MVKTFRFDEFGYEIEIGKFARQADGAVWFKHGGTVILSTVCSAELKDFPGFLPLTIDYREMFSAAGKIPGGYYKREGKPSDREILTSRLIDRAVRPLFPEHFFNSVQILSTVYSVDKIHAPNTISLIASSLAIGVSKLPFLGPVGAVEVARVNKEWIFNPTYPQTVASDVRLVIAGTHEGITMVEGSADEISEDEFIDVMFRAHEIIKRLVAWQEQVQKELAIEQEPVEDMYQLDHWNQLVNAFLTEDRVTKLYIPDKVERNQYISDIKEAFAQEHKEAIEAQTVPQSVIDYVFEKALTLKITELIFKYQKRIDNRAFDQIRHISVEVGLLPCAHGSALFTRGRTQALVSVTLGGGQDEQKFDSIMDGDESGSFMLHYNFPPFSVGEARPLRGVSRRETGHGHLAASSLKYVLPKKEEFPYTIRIVADMLESDGSTSMATACGSTMALMQAGVPIKKMVGGIAMGLLQNQRGDFQVLSDISGFEDAYGLMDFKVVGTENGITAIQMDIKYKGGLARSVFEKALAQARQGRLHILGEMKKVMSKPNETLSDLVPKVVTFKIAQDKIGAVIGGGGKTIREIIDKTKTTIDIEDDGSVKIFGGPDSELEQAIHWVKTLAGQIERGSIFTGKIKRIAEFGLFVELVPGFDGLVHVSNIPRALQKTFGQHYKVDTMVKVQVLDYDPQSERVSLKIVE